jgi:hypothetical protein
MSRWLVGSSSSKMSASLREHHAEVQAPALAAGEARRRALHVGVAEAEVWAIISTLPLQRVAAREVVAIGGGDQPREALVRAARRRVLGVAQGLAQREDLAEARQERGAHRPLGAHLVGLAVVGDLRFAAAGHGAAVGRKLAADQPQQRALARAVGSHEAGPLAEREREGDALEQRICAVTEAEVGDLQHGHGASLPRGRGRNQGGAWCGAGTGFGSSESRLKAGSACRSRA